MDILFTELSNMPYVELIVLISLFVICFTFISLTLYIICQYGLEDHHVSTEYCDPDPDCNICKGTGFLDAEKSIGCVCTDKVM